MTMQTVPLTIRWHINPDHSIALQVHHSNGLTPQPVLDVTLTADQLVRLIEEHACRAQGLVWTEEPTP